MTAPQPAQAADPAQVRLARRPLPDQLRYLARKLFDGAGGGAVAFTLQVIADEMSDAASAALLSLAAEFEREAAASVSAVGESALRFAARMARERAAASQETPGAPGTGTGEGGSAKEPHSAAERRTTALTAIAKALVEAASDFGTGDVIAGDVWVLAAAALDAVPQVATTPHEYLSTSCLHGEHGYCQSPTGSNGATDWTKAPACCKFCRAPCICPCHVSSSVLPPAALRAAGDTEASGTGQDNGGEENGAQEGAQAVLLPAENLALTVARAQLERGENPPVNTTAVLVLALDRLTGATP